MAKGAVGVGELPSLHLSSFLGFWKISYGFSWALSCSQNTSQYLNTSQLLQSWGWQDHVSRGPGCKRDHAALKLRAKQGDLLNYHLAFNSVLQALCSPLIQNENSSFLHKKRKQSCICKEPLENTQFQLPAFHIFLGSEAPAMCRDRESRSFYRDPALLKSFTQQLFVQGQQQAWEVMSKHYF